MEFSEVIRLKDSEKLEYLRNNNAQLDESIKIAILKSLRIDRFKIASLRDEKISLGLKAKLGFMMYLDDGHISEEYYSIWYELLKKSVKAFDDKEKVNCINDRNIGFGIKVTLIELLEDDKLKIDYLENYNVNFSQDDKASIVCSLKNDQTKVEYLNKLELEYEPLDVYNKTKLISSLLDDTLKMDYLMKCLTDSKLNFYPYDSAKIISSLSNKQLKADCLINPDIGLDLDAKVKIVCTLDESIKTEYLTNPGIKLDEYQRANIISSFSDNRLKIKYLSEPSLNSYARTNIIKSLTEEALLIDCLNNPDIELNLENRVDLIKLVQDEQIIETLLIDCLNNPDFELYSSDIVKILNLLEDGQIKEALLIDILNNPDMEIDSSNRAEIVSYLQDDETKINYMKDVREDDKLWIILSLQDKNIIKSLLPNFDIEYVILSICSLKGKNKSEMFEKSGIIPDVSFKKALKLPPNMTMGVELEAEGFNSKYLELEGEILDGWEITSDDSLQDGVEIVSPILHSTKEDMYSLATVCDIMQTLRFTTSKRCGGHIHFGADFLGEDYKAWENFYTIYNECEEIFYKMSNETGQVPRENILEYAMPSNKTILSMFEAGDVHITEENFEEVMKALQDTKYRGVNVINLGTDGKNTIEFRMPNGTIDVQVIRDNMMLFGSLLQVSKEMSVNPEYKKEEFEIVKQKDLIEREKVDNLLNLLFDNEQERGIYIERWDAVKDDVHFDKLKSEKPTFKRIRKEVAECFNETRAEDRANFVQMAREEMSDSEVFINVRDRI